ncbi:PEGA domain-containing protein [Lujinxingia vulgaris]|uniref:PEGA domain-containing protein n=2 Tax=Lujinxingia vulgaris TaxID=2600176 RepID=A0A5C6WVS9_9DELT|nr:PEGA domain-containing protein [Lujinxingia vulgaris]
MEPKPATAARAEDDPEAAPEEVDPVAVNEGEVERRAEVDAEPDAQAIEDSELRPDEAPSGVASAADAYHSSTRAPRVRSQPVREEATRQVRLASTPPGARVSANGQPLGTTPLSWQAPLEGAVRLNFSLIGYQDHQIELSPESAEDEVEVTLRRARLELMP